MYAYFVFVVEAMLRCVVYPHVIYHPPFSVFPALAQTRAIKRGRPGTEANRCGRSKLPAPSSYTSDVRFFALRGSLMIVEFSYLL